MSHTFPPPPPPRAHPPHSQTLHAFHPATRNVKYSKRHGRDYTTVQTWVLAVQMKNCDPLVFGPPFAMERIPAIETTLDL